VFAKALSHTPPPRKKLPYGVGGCRLSASNGSPSCPRARHRRPVNLLLCSAAGTAQPRNKKVGRPRIASVLG